MAIALITGASSGIGAAFAQALAKRNYDLVLVARSQDKLQALATQLSQQQGVQATVIPQDLTAEGAVAKIIAELEQKEITVDLLINNAGFGTYGEFAESDLDNYLTMIQLNIAVLVELTHRCLPGMKARQAGSILNIGSTASFQPLPYFSVYAATKAFVLSFSEALWHECKPYGIEVLAVCPGPTETSFAEVADFPSSIGEQFSQNAATPEAVVTEALQALDQASSNVVTGGLMNQVMVNANRFFPREMVLNAVGRMFSTG